MSYNFVLGKVQKDIYTELRIQGSMCLCSFSDTKHAKLSASDL